MPCPMCRRLIKNRSRPGMLTSSSSSSSGDALVLGFAVPRSKRSERARRWDHLRKRHGLTTCDKCALRLSKDEVAEHNRVCAGGVQVDASDESGDSQCGALYLLYNVVVYPHPYLLLCASPMVCPIPSLRLLPLPPLLLLLLLARCAHVSRLHALQV